MAPHGWGSPAGRVDTHACQPCTPLEGAGRSGVRQPESSHACSIRAPLVLRLGASAQPWICLAPLLSPVRRPPSRRLQSTGAREPRMVSVSDTFLAPHSVHTHPLHSGHRSAALYNPTPSTRAKQGRWVGSVRRGEQSTQPTHLPLDENEQEHTHNPIRTHAPRGCAGPSARRRHRGAPGPPPCVPPAARRRVRRAWPPPPRRSSCTAPPGNQISRGKRNEEL